LDGGPIIQNKINKDTFYISGFPFLTILPGLDIFKLFIIVLSVIFVAWGISTFKKRRSTAKKVDRRISSLKTQFNNIKEESYNNDGGSWIQKELNGDSNEYDDLMSLKRK